METEKYVPASQEVKRAEGRMTEKEKEMSQEREVTYEAGYKKKDEMLKFFNCEASQVATNASEINENTKAYVGEWNVEIFQKIKNYPNITHLYESFPDRKIFMQTLETDPSINSPAKAEEAMKDKNISLSNPGKDTLEKTDFSQKKETYNLVRFAIEQLGLPDGATTDEIYAKAKELGLELCPAEVGPQLRLQYPGKEWMIIAMEKISSRDTSLRMFELDWNDRSRRLALNSTADPGGRWRSDIEFVFLSHK